MRHSQEIKTHKLSDKVGTPLKYKRLIIGLIVLSVITFLLLSLNQPPSLDKTLKQPAPEIDIAKSALIVAKEVFPDININSYLRKLDRMADEIRLIMFKGGGNASDPEYRIRAINTYFFYVQKYSYDNADFFGRQATNCFLNGIMDTRKGACFTMPLLYLCLARRLGFPIYGVNVPQHFFLRYDDGKYRANIEVTCKGAMGQDEVYIEDFQILTGELEAGVFMRNLSDQQVVSNIIEARGNYYLRINNYQKAIRDLEKVVELNPTNSETFYNLSKIYRRHWKDTILSDKCLSRCKELGYDFNRKENERDVKYIDYFIKVSKLNGIDTTELEALRNKELSRQTEWMMQNMEENYQALMKANAANKVMMPQRTLPPPNPMPPNPMPPDPLPPNPDPNPIPNPNNEENMWH